MIILAVKSILFHWRQTLLLVFGIALACSVLTGALIMGDSVRHTLIESAATRLGKIEVALGAGQRLFPAGIRDRATGWDLSPVLSLRGVAIVDSDDSGPVEIPGVQVVGVDPGFWRFAHNPPEPLDRRALYINAALARRLPRLQPESLSVRVPKPSNLPQEAPLVQSGQRDTARFRGTIAGILAADQLGNFGLAAEQQPRPTVFVPLDQLRAALEMEDEVNLFVGKMSSSSTAALAEKSIREALLPSDYGIEIRREQQRVVITSRRVFLEPVIARALADLPGSVPSLTYLVNRISRIGPAPQKSTPYSFVQAVGADSLTSGVQTKAGEVREQIAEGAAINSWLAQELGLSRGSEIQADYYVLSADGGLREEHAKFKIVEIDPVDEWAAERALGPQFPGLTDVETCRAWDIGMPMDDAALRDEANEAYWQAYGATPKLKVPLELGQKLWGNRYGKVTAVTLPDTEELITVINGKLREAVAPEDIGLPIRHVRQQAMEAVDGAMDFGQLFLGMSFFIVVGSLMLAGLLIAFGLQGRLSELGLLGAVGFSGGQMVRQFLIESVFATCLGCLIGSLGSPVYTRILISIVNGRWRGAVAGASISYHAALESFVIGFSAVVILGLLVAWAVVRGACKAPPIDLLRRGQSSPDRRTGRGGADWALYVGSGLLTTAVITAMVCVRMSPDKLAGPFFGVGTLLLGGLSVFTFYILNRLASGRKPLMSIGALAVGGLARRPARSTVVFTLTATGCFLVFAVAGMTRDLSADAGARNSGTGGFELYAESAIGIRAERTVDNPGGELFADLSAAGDISVVPLRLRDGDDASCLNLNSAPEPIVMGVDAKRMKQLAAFEKVNTSESVWDLLINGSERAPDEKANSDGGVAGQSRTIPALAGDIDTATWGLRLRAHPQKGGTLDYLNSRGETITVKLVGRLPHRLTLFQGRILVSLEDFARAFPTEKGYRAFLFDVSPGAVEQTVQELRRAYGRSGLDIQLGSQRLAAFYRVEETYLRIFLILGGIGVILGTAGLGIVTLKNMLDRRNELALLQATGFTRARIFGIVAGEAIICLLLGITTGIAASLVAVLPGLLSGFTHPPVGTMAWVVALVTANGVFWSVLAAGWVLRMPLVPSLRGE